MIDPTGE